MKYLTLSFLTATFLLISDASFADGGKTKKENKKECKSGAACGSAGSLRRKALSSTNSTPQAQAAQTSK